MGLFTFRYSERESELEKALQGIHFGREVRFGYSGQGKEQQKQTTSPVYLLPLDVHNGVIYGYFMLDEKLVEVPIGFLRRNNFLFKEHFNPNLDGNLVKENGSRERTLYLPLKLTDLVMDIGIEKDEKWVAHEGSPFPLFGVEGSQGTYPLILVSETEERIICKGMYKQKGGQLSTYDHQAMRSSDQQVREVLKKLRGVKPTLPEKRALQETAQIGTGKTLGPATLLEVTANGDINLEEPKSIVSYLNHYVIGQDEAKMIISVAFSNYMTKVRTKMEDLPKENVLCVGPSGVGKTYMLSLLAKKASLPFVQSKLTGKSTEGYKGENLSTVFEQLRAQTTGEAPYGIVFLDEIDKLARDEWGSGSGFGPRLQDELIGWLEEAVIMGPEDPAVKKKERLNTKNLLFVTAGAFQGSSGSSLVDIIQKRLGKGQRQIGFGQCQGDDKTSTEYPLLKVRPEDLIKYGLKPELVGRLPSLAVFKPLTTDDKVRILTEAKRSPFTQYTELLKLKGYALEIEPTVPTLIASFCPEETGARALSSICNDLFTEIMFEPDKYATNQKVILVTPDLARKLINLYG